MATTHGRSTTTRRSLADDPARIHNGRTAAPCDVRVAGRSVGTTDVHRRRLESRRANTAMTRIGAMRRLGALYLRLFLSRVDLRAARAVWKRASRPTLWQHWTDRLALRRLRARHLDERIDETSGGEYIDPDFPEFSGASTICCTVTTTHAISRSSDNSTAVQRSLGLVAWACAQSSAMLTIAITASRRPSRARRTRIERDRMLGGQATVHFDPRDQVRFFTTLSRGYKAGGFNLGRAATFRSASRPNICGVSMSARRRVARRRALC